MTRAAVFLHVGARKSGTTFLQRTLQWSTDPLAAQGVRLIHEDGGTALEGRLHKALVAGVRGDAAAAQEAVAALADDIAGHGAATHVLSYENLAELPAEAADLLVGGLADFDTHVVVTARPWGLTIPSEWQQSVKARSTATLAEFVASIRDGAPEARQFLDRQDLPGIVGRWGARLSPDRVHVVACPPSSRTEGTLVDLFCGVVGIDPATLEQPATTRNESLSLAQTELLRRVNAALPRSLRRASGDYGPAVRQGLTREVLMRVERDKVVLPAELGAWCAEAARDQLAAVRALGVDLVGRADDLLFDAARATGPMAPDEAEVAGVAVEVVAALVERRHRERSRLEQRLAKVTAQRDRLREAAAAATGGAVRSWRARIRRTD